MGKYDDIKELADEIYLIAAAAQMSCSKFARMDNSAQDVYNVAQDELFNYLLHLSCADGQIDYTEANFISEVCGITAPPRNLEAYAIERGIFSPDFWSMVPNTFKLICMADKLASMQGKDADMAMRVIEIYRAIGNILIGVDGHKSSGEIGAHALIIDTMEEYRSIQKYGDDTSTGLEFKDYL